LALSSTKRAARATSWCGGDEQLTGASAITVAECHARPEPRPLPAWQSALNIEQAARNSGNCSGEALQPLQACAQLVHSRVIGLQVSAAFFGVHASSTWPRRHGTAKPVHPDCRKAEMCSDGAPTVPLPLQLARHRTVNPTITPPLCHIRSPSMAMLLDDQQGPTGARVALMGTAMGHCAPRMPISIYQERYPTDRSRARVSLSWRVWLGEAETIMVSIHRVYYREDVLDGAPSSTHCEAHDARGPIVQAHPALAKTDPRYSSRFHCSSSRYQVQTTCSADCAERVACHYVPGSSLVATESLGLVPLRSLGAQPLWPSASRPGSAIIFVPAQLFGRRASSLALRKAATR